MPARPCLFVACAPSGSRIHPPYVKLFRKNCPAESTRIVERPKNQGPEQLQVEAPFAIRVEYHHPPVRRPDRLHLHRGVEGEARAQAAHQIVYPDVLIVSLGYLDGGSLLVRRELHPAQASRISGGGERLAAPVHPSETEVVKLRASLICQQPGLGGGKQTVLIHAPALNLFRQWRGTPRPYRLHPAWI